MKISEISYTNLQKYQFIFFRTKNIQQISEIFGGNAGQVIKLGSGQYIF